MIELKQLTRRFGEFTAVREMSLRVEEGELLVLVGGSGSGKTTTLKMINRLIEPTSGTVLIDGQDTRGMAPHTLRRQIGYAFQRVGLFPHMSVGENIAIPLTLAGWDAPRIARRVDELLELVELAPGITAERRSAELSGGQEQRVGVARALAASPRLMLLDEPFGALDPLTRDRLQQSFLRIRRQLALTAVFVTHDMAEALLMGDRIGIMREGNMIQIGTPRELLHAPADDYVQQLIETPMRQASVVDALLGTASA